MFKIATWNVNSLRVRLPHVLNWLAAHQPDCLVLQETKVIDADFPKADIEAAGYHVAYTGQKTYNGVAILSKTPMTNIVLDLPAVDADHKRFIAATVAGVRIVNVYVPNGASLDSPKYPYKLDWLEKLAHYLQTQVKDYAHLALMGDFNIAPSDADIAEPDKWQGQVLASAPERAAFDALLATGLADTLKTHIDTTGIYSWWDYRNGAYWKNIGLRIDHILTSPALLQNVQDCAVDKRERQRKRPSDHAPVWAEFEYNQ